MNKRKFPPIARILAVLVLAAGTIPAQAQAPAPERLGGVLSDYTPFVPATVTGPYEMRGHWSLKLKKEGTKADFSAFMTMELTDYYIIASGKDASDPTVRGQHTHHIEMTDATVNYNPTGCPADSPATTVRFAVSGTANFITGNGSPGPFEKNGPTALQICITGGTDVTYSNMTMVMTGPATGHFGTQAIHGVVRFETKKEEQEQEKEHRW